MRNTYFHLLDSAIQNRKSQHKHQHYKPWQYWATAVLCCQSAVKMEKKTLPAFRECFQMCTWCSQGMTVQELNVTCIPEMLLKRKVGNKGVITRIQENPIGLQWQVLNLQWKLSPCKIWFSSACAEHSQFLLISFIYLSTQSSIWTVFPSKQLNKTRCLLRKVFLSLKSNQEN